MAHAIPADANMQEHQRVDSKDVLSQTCYSLSNMFLAYLFTPSSILYLKMAFPPDQAV